MLRQRTAAAPTGCCSFLDRCLYSPPSCPGTRRANTAGVANPLYVLFRKTVPLKPKPRPEDLPNTRHMYENGCIKNEAINFPNPRSSPDGKPSPIIGVEDWVEYRTIDFFIPPQTPPPDSEEKKENEEEVMGTLPDRRLGDGENGGEDDDEDLW